MFLNTRETYRFTACREPIWRVSSTHNGNFQRGGTGTYTVTVRNTGLTASVGIVSVADMLPLSLPLTAIAGMGWNCQSTTAICTRADSLPPNTSFSPIVLTVRVNANTPRVTNSVLAFGGGARLDATANDLTTIVP